MTGWKDLRTGISIAVTVCAATLALPHRATADPITPYLGFAVNGTCVAGTCSPSVLTSGSASLSYDDNITLANGDIFQVDANLTATPISTGGSGVSPVSVEYIGDGHGGASLPGDTITTDIYKASSLSSQLTLISSVTGGFGGGIASGSTAGASLNGTSLGTFSSDNGAFSSPVVTVGNVGPGTLDIDRAYTSTFAAGSPAGAYITYNGAPAPPPPPPPPTPTCAQILTGAVAHPTLSGLSLSNEPTMIGTTFTPQGGVTLSQAAKACGVEGFDWQQTIESYPLPAQFFPQSGAPLTFPSSDPVKGGWNYCVSSLTFDCQQSYPFFFDPKSDAGNLLGLAAHTNDNSSINFHDEPQDACMASDVGLNFSLAPVAAVIDKLHTTLFGCPYLAPVGSEEVYTTRLVGYDDNFDLVDLSQYTNGTDIFKWESNYNYAFGGVSTAIQPDDSSGDLGNGFGGVTLLSFDGMSAVPEPPSVVMLAMAIVLVSGCSQISKLRKRLKDAPS